jgi:UDP-N-acetyl-D-glucosamine dehydrogenase
MNMSVRGGRVAEQTQSRSEREGEPDWVAQLKSRINAGAATLGVIGLGHVGLPLAVAFARKFRVYGYDTNRELVHNIERGKSHIDDVPDSALGSLAGKTLFPTTDEEVFSSCDCLIISVPTPLSANKEPDLVYVRAAVEAIARHLRKGHLVILESTTYPGTTRTVVVPILERTKLKAARDFGVAYSPERVDPGNKHHSISNTPKVVGGINSACTELAAQLFRTTIENVVPVSSCEVAEATKMLENIFRAVNIALINEMAVILDRMDINTWEVIRAASTKPYGFMEFHPGPGIGGHCIPLDPFYMSYRAKQFNAIARFIELSGEINEFMKFYTVNLVIDALLGVGKAIENSNIAVFGLSYKKDIRDTRESPAQKIIEELHERGGKIKVYDPLAHSIETRVGKFSSEATVEDALRNSDVALLLTNHSIFQQLGTVKFEEHMRKRPVVVDTRDILDMPPAGVVYVGLGKGRRTS